jgi:predicted permease
MSRLSRFVNQWRRPALDRQFDDELQFHLDTRADANVRAGMSRADAEAEARRHFGSTLRAREGMREARVSGLLEGMARDLRHGWRVFRRQPGLALLVLLTLSLGIGANAAIFSLLNAMLFRPLPFASADRLVAVLDGFRDAGPDALSRGTTTPTIPELLDVAERSRTLEGVSFFDTRDVQINGGSEPVRALVGRVEPSLLALLGTRPALGRLFTAADGQGGAARVVILSHNLWRQNFGADPAAVGRQLVVNGAASTIVGVTAPEFTLDAFSAEPIELFIPYAMVPIYTSRDAEFANVRRVTGIARVRPGVPIETVSGELRGIARALAGAYPALYQRDSNGQDLGFRMDAQPLRDLVGGGTRRVRPVLMLLFGAVGLVLLIACVNTAQFLLAQSIDRGPEVAVRTALGAGRGRLLRQFLSESLLVAGIAGALGVLQAVWLTRVLARWLPESAPLVGPIDVDRSVLLFVAGIALLTTMVCGLLPAIRFSSLQPGRRLVARGLAARLSGRQVLVAIEVAVSVLLLVSAGLVLQSIRALHAEPGGYSAEQVTVMRLRGISAPNERLGPVYRRYLEQVTSLPGVAAAAITSGPLPGAPGTDFTIIGRSADQATLSRQVASYQMISQGYFAALRIPVLEGRTFADADDRSRPPVAIVNAELARRYFPGRSAVGQQIRAGSGPRVATMTIVGVVGNVRRIMQAEQEAQIYASTLQQEEPSVALLVRAADGQVVTETAVKQAIWSVTPQQAVFGIRPMTDLLAQTTQDQRVVAMLLSVFALLAVVMSAGGVYTLVNYLTTRRVKEIALRRAIGARAYDILTLLAGPTFRWTVVGLIAGIAAAIAGGRALQSVLVGMASLDLATVALAGALYLAVVAVAMCVPALRALRIDPAAALRAE